MSRARLPKQMLPLIDDHSMFRTSVERIRIDSSLPERYLCRHRPRTGAGAAEGSRADSARKLHHRTLRQEYGARVGPRLELHPEAQSESAPSLSCRRSSYRAAGEILPRPGSRLASCARWQIVTLGISPSHPATGFGYIQQGPALAEVNGFKVYQSRRFTEKPDIVRATQFLASGQYSWNSGMFIWRVDRAMRDFERYQPAIFAMCSYLQSAFDAPDYEEKLKRHLGDDAQLSIDFAIMEKADNIAVIPDDIGWSDVGNWTSLYDILPQDNFGNCIKGDASDIRVILDTRDTLVFSDRLTVAIGVEDIVVVDTDDVLLICHKDRTQDVKQVVDYLRENGNEEYL